jgi:hypothetical protein
MKKKGDDLQDTVLGVSAKKREGGRIRHSCIEWRRLAISANRCITA